MDRYTPRPTRIGLAFAAGLALLSAGCALHGNAAPCGPTPTVILIRGVGGYWPGVSNLESLLQSEGYRTWTVPPALVHCVADSLASQPPECRGPLCIIGYSLGGNGACSLARLLGQRGVAINGMLLVETNSPDSVPANVPKCFNIYVSRPTDFIPVFRGLPVMADDPDATELMNVNLREDTAVAEVIPPVDHFKLASTPQMHDLLFAHVRTIMTSGSLPPFGYAPTGGPPLDVVEKTEDYVDSTDRR